MSPDQARGKMRSALFTGDIVAYFFTAAPRFACSRRAENKMESHEHPSCHFSNIFLFLIIKGKDEKGKHSREKIFYKRKEKYYFCKISIRKDNLNIDIFRYG